MGRFRKYIKFLYQYVSAILKKNEFPNCLFVAFNNSQYDVNLIKINTAPKGGVPLPDPQLGCDWDLMGNCLMRPDPSGVSVSSQ